MKLLFLPLLIIMGSGSLAVEEAHPGAATTVGAIALLVTALATAYGVVRRTQRQTSDKLDNAEAKVRRNTEKIDQDLSPKVQALDENAVRREELEGYREFIAFARQTLKEVQQELADSREATGAERARADERYRQMQEQYLACEQGRTLAMSELERLRGEFNEHRRMMPLPTPPLTTNGENGEKGEKGDKGEKGAKGEPGEPGKPAKPRTRKAKA